jgi:amidase
MSAAARGLLAGKENAEARRQSKPAFTPAEFDLMELGIAELQQKMVSGEISARSLTQKYLERMDEIDRNGPMLRAVIEVNPDALDIAEQMDKRRRQAPVGPLHGIPVLIKDNIDTADRTQTTAGSLALLGARPPRDAFVVDRLRKAGAVLLGKTNLSEWANGRGNNSTSGWSARGGLTRNPYALDRCASGSSSGSAVAVSANLCAIAVGTETDGSIVSPSSVNGIVGIKPTVGLVSRAGIIPLTLSQDTAGPLARSVRDAVLLLEVLASADSDDEASLATSRPSQPRYRDCLDPQGLRGLRIGVVRKLMGFHRDVDRVMEEALQAIKAAGATLIDPVEIDTLGKYNDAEMTVIYYELKATLNRYLNRPGMDSPVRSLQQIIEFNRAHRDREMPCFGQETFEKAEATDSLENPEYREALSSCQRLSRSEGIDAALKRRQLDVLIAPTEGPAWLIDLIDGDHIMTSSSTPAAVAGYPSITVPAGFVGSLPVGISFFGSAWSEETLIRAAFGFEQVTHSRRAPQFLAAAGPGAT